MRSSVDTSRLTPPLRLADALLSASSPDGTCESAMNAAASARTSAANDVRNCVRSRNRKPSCIEHLHSWIRWTIASRKLVDRENDRSLDHLRNAVPPAL